MIHPHGSAVLAVGLTPGMVHPTIRFAVLVLFLTLLIPRPSWCQDLHSAVRSGDLVAVESLLDDNPLLVNQLDGDGRTPLFSAILRQDHDMARLLIRRGAGVRVGDSNLRAPIHYAGFLNDTIMMGILLENGAVVDTRAIGAATPLIHSSLSDREALSRYLIRHGADFDVQCNSLTTPLYFAALNDNLSYLDALLGEGADPDVPDFLGRTPLQVAVRDGHLVIVERLLAEGVDPRGWQDHLSRGLLHLAAMRGRTEIAAVLLGEGMEVNALGARGWTPMDYADRYGHDSLARWLSERGGRKSGAAGDTGVVIDGPEEPNTGEAVVVKLQNGSWGIRTHSHFLILGYSEMGVLPPEPSLRNGHLTGSELSDLSWVSFDLTFQPPEASIALQGHTPLYALQDSVQDLTFVLNDAFASQYTPLGIRTALFPADGATLRLDGLSVTMIPSFMGQKGFLIQCDGLSLFWLGGLSHPYLSTVFDTGAVDTVRRIHGGVDLLFLGLPDGIGPERGNSAREAYLGALELSPRAVFFLGKEPLERRIRGQIQRRTEDVDRIHIADAPGEVFFVRR